MKLSPLGKVCVCLALLSLPAMAQRHGRPDGLQNYTKSLRPTDPLLNIHLLSEKKWLYLHRSELRKMIRTTIHITDPVSQKVTVYEGVAVSELLHGGTTHYAIDIYREGSFVFPDKLAFSTELQSHDPSLIVADTKDGKNLKTDDPYVIVSSAEGRQSGVLHSLAFIRATARP